MAGRAFLILVTSSDDNLPVKASTPSNVYLCSLGTLKASLPQKACLRRRVASTASSERDRATSTPASRTKDEDT